VPFFAYKARNARGELMQGVLEGADSGAVADQLFNAGVTPSRLRSRAAAPPKRRPAWAKLLEKGQAYGRAAVQPPDVHAAQVRRAHHARAGRFAGIGHQSCFRPRAQGFARVAGRGARTVGGDARHPKVFSEFYLSMVRVGEMTGRLDEVFLRLFDHLEFDRDMRARVKPPRATRSL
jgi:MSHA biogenesis protein MshG